MTKYDRLAVAYRDAQDILESLDIKFGPIVSVTINSRAKSRWGQCKFNKNLGKFFIEINSELLDESVSYEALMNTVIHEMLHASKDRFDSGHKGAWKTCADKVNYYYPQFNIKRATSLEEKGISNNTINYYKYLITCDGCGYVNKYKRKSSAVKELLSRPKNSRCRCGVCGSNNFTVKCV